MAPEEIKQKLQELVDSAGKNPSDALLPAALLQLIKANEDNAQKIAEVKEEIESKSQKAGDKIDQNQKEMSKKMDDMAKAIDDLIVEKAKEQAEQTKQNNAKIEKIIIGFGASTVILLLAILGVSFYQVIGG